MLYWQCASPRYYTVHLKKPDYAFHQTNPHRDSKTQCILGVICDFYFTFF